MIEIDQSNKVERLEKDTILAFSNHNQYTIRIPSKVKRKVFSKLQAKGKSRKNAYLWIFSTGVFLLLKPHLFKLIIRHEIITIDTEYTGQEANIKNMILQHCNRYGLELPADRIRFAQIGKASGAHERAYTVQRGKEKANKRISINDFLKLM